MAVRIERNTVADPQTKKAVEAAVIAGLTQRGGGDWTARIEEPSWTCCILVSFSGRDALDNCAFWDRDPERMRWWLANVTII
jgi:hypothetical protein